MIKIDIGPSSNRRILGVEFFTGSAEAAISRMKGGGLLVVPAAPALKDLDDNPGYRDALLKADLVLTDSALMVMIWNALQLDSIRRVSGLEYLRALLLDEDIRRPGNTLWVMANPISARRNARWLAGQGFNIASDDIYIAPKYGAEIEDEALADIVNRLRPEHIIVTIGGGTQERLGLYLKRNSNYRPAIHCVGAAIAFLSGDQVKIPVWADKYYLGWLLRSLSEPARYVPRYWAARKLFGLMYRYGSNLPPLKVTSHPVHSSHIAS